MQRTHLGLLPLTSSIFVHGCGRTKSKHMYVFLVSRNRRQDNSIMILRSVVTCLQITPFPNVHVLNVCACPLLFLESTHMYLLLDPYTTTPTRKRLFRPRAYIMTFTHFQPTRVSE